MKKQLLTTLTVLLSQQAYTLPLSNPIEASLYTEGVRCLNCRGYEAYPCWKNEFGVRIGFYGDYVSNRNLQVNAFSNNNANCIQTTTLFTNAGTITFNFWNWIDLYVLMGATHLNLTSNSSVFTLNTTNQAITQLDFSPTFAWGVGGRATLWECHCFGIGVEGQYFRTRPYLNSSTTAQSIVYFNNFDTPDIYSEWQVGIGLSYRFVTRDLSTSFVPYVGAKWANAALSMNNTAYAQSGAGFYIPNLENGKVWGCAAGATLTVYNTFGVTVEGRWADESSVYAEGQLRF
ncbi:MAG: hypothetical protein JSS62_05135 [Verrucomicrobia bacterium]|nr:hypothetical protein [Verrucomicrobiota bacterium]MBS0647468.1 hypothetical protein [Verrucomicrobiota bacterium]